MIGYPQDTAAKKPGKNASKEERESYEQEMKWRAESDLRTIIEAEKIKADAERMQAAMKCRDEMKKQLNKVGD